MYKRQATSYFVCAEALANIGVYAQASHATCTVARDVDALRINVADDGIGGADTDRGSGLRGLHDRVQSLGGSLQVDGPPGRGTTLTAIVALAEPPA